ncbi:hypothetical protein [Mycobacterium sp. SMC-4]|uniref:hypothetical protein n=1 Tax=Mycobacterium sp. SMC-4 TaxID=2857059 RepID=UPI0021B17279|nr:hypothetical protein [Mycobacterium sp. SMC-4]UXA17657.1 hypothetical protein KXD98_23610 [Mycobacterium sp. SMC-4]
MSTTVEPENYAAIRAAGIAETLRTRPSGYTERDAANIDRWRQANPNALRTWTTTYGCVVAFGGMLVYYGRCKHCGDLVTTRRKMAYRPNNGRWPYTCQGCRSRREKKHNADAKHRMRALRRRTEFPADGDPYAEKRQQFASAARERYLVECKRLGIKPKHA